MELCLGPFQTVSFALEYIQEYWGKVHKSIDLFYSPLICNGIFTFSILKTLLWYRKKSKIKLILKSGWSGFGMDLSWDPSQTVFFVLGKKYGVYPKLILKRDEVQFCLRMSPDGLWRRDTEQICYLLWATISLLKHDGISVLLNTSFWGGPIKRGVGEGVN